MFIYCYHVPVDVDSSSMGVGESRDNDACDRHQLSVCPFLLVLSGCLRVLVYTFFNGLSVHNSFHLNVILCLRKFFMFEGDVGQHTNKVWNLPPKRGGKGSRFILPCNC